MTKEEIKALISAKLAGQGTNIDAASVLPAILNAIVDNMSTMPPAKFTLPDDIGLDIDLSQFAAAIGVTVAEIPTFFDAQVVSYKGWLLTRQAVLNDGISIDGEFGATTGAGGAQLSVLYAPSSDDVTISFETT